MFQKRLALFIIVLTTVLPVFGQQESEPDKLGIQPHNAIAIVPQYAFSNGIRVDYEKRLKNSDHWLVFAPQFYLDAVNTRYYYYNDGSYASYESMVGFGINLYYKTIVYKSNNINWNSGLPRHSLYISAGPNYQQFSLSNTEEVAVPYLDNGITYYQFDVQEVKKPIFRFGAIGNVGWQLAFDRFLLDLYLGLAIKYSVGEGGTIIKTDYPSWNDMTYTGILLDGGVRIGIFF